MTTTVTTAEAIRTTLAATTGGVFAEKASNLLAALGYGSDHVLPTQPASVGDFIAEYPAPNPGTQSELTFADNAQSVQILFQFTDAEITSTTQQALLNAEGFSTGNARSFLFVAVELKGDNYARGHLVPHGEMLPVYSGIVSDADVISMTVTTSPRRPTFLQQARWDAVQKAKLEGMSIRKMARELGLHRDTVRRYIDVESPPTRRSPATLPASTSDTVPE